MPQPFLAMIIPVGQGGPVDPGYFPPGVGQPGGQPGYPSHPIAGQPGHPSHPIAGPPPGVPTHPIYIDGVPTHPIALPPPQQPGQPPQVSHPIILPGDPTHPIVLPPEIPPGSGGGGPMAIEWKAGWTQATGWIVIGIPQEPHPTPSAGQPAGGTPQAPVPPQPARR